MVKYLKVKMIKMNYKIVAKYIKEIKFNIPNPKIFFLLSENIKNYKINIDIKIIQFKEKIIEVETSLTLNLVESNIDKIDTKIVQSTIIEVEGDITSKNDLEKIILIDVPTEIYSEIRDSFIFLFEKSGFKNIKIDEKVDFEDLYKKRRIQ